MYLLLDYACSAPYVDIDLSKSDGIFFSGHKFLGGQSSPGVLIANEALLEVSHPYEPGGGCVEKADDMSIIYKTDPEMKEMGGTPNIVGIIRLGYVMMIKKSIMDVIENNEKILSKYVTHKMRKLQEQYETFKVIGIDTKTEHDLPIYPITIQGLHYNLITVLFNDLFGIQTRGGISCCGTLGRICKDMFAINGWCRISFNYLLTKDEVEKIINAIEYIIVHGEEYKQYYDYDAGKNLYTLKMDITEPKMITH